LVLSVKATDTFAGAFFVVAGAVGVALSGSLPMGTATNMSAGYVPQALSWLLVVIGAGIAAGGLLSREPQHLEAFPLRPLALVGCALAAFAASVDTVGLPAAVVGTVALGALATPESRLSDTALLATGLAVVSWLLFVVALGVPFRILPWN
jgi:hypothetical protein